VIIPAYNPGGLLERCLASIPDDAEVIVVDNGSRGTQVKETAARFARVRFIFLGRNTGFAFACNRGARAARGRVLVFLNQDAEILEPGYRAALRHLLADERRGVVGGKVLYPDGRVQETVRRFPGYLDFLFGRRTLLSRLFPRSRRSIRYLAKDMAFDKTQRVEVCSGMFLMVRREAFESLGGFDEGFFFYVEDMDFSRRAFEAGWETWYVAQPAAVHHLGENIPGSDRTLVKMHHYKGIYRYLVKHKRPPAPLRGLLWLASGIVITGHLALSKPLAVLKKG